MAKGVVSNDPAMIKAKRAKIEEMLEMQRKFMEIEHEQGVTLKDLYHEPEGFLGEYMEKYQSLATDVVDSAHEVKGSIRT